MWLPAFMIQVKRRDLSFIEFYLDATMKEKNEQLLF